MSKQPFTTTLNEIRNCSPCPDGWTTLLRTLGKTKADDEPLSLLTILDSNGLDDALWCARAVSGHERDFRLFAVWCARQVQHLINDESSLVALDVAEKFADGKVTEQERAARAAWSAAWLASAEAARAAWSAAWLASEASASSAEAAWLAARAASAEAQEQRLRKMIQDGGWIGSTQGE